MTHRCLLIPRTPDFVVGPENDLYLKRWWVIPHNKWFNIYLHQFLRSDDDSALHDHPWWNVSILLTGRYLEVMHSYSKIRYPFIPVARRATAAHRVELMSNEPVWTLFITGCVVRNWGFHCPKGWVPWQDFVTQRESGNSMGPGCQ